MAENKQKPKKHKYMKKSQATSQRKKKSYREEKNSHKFNCSCSQHIHDCSLLSNHGYHQISSRWLEAFGHTNNHLPNTVQPK